MNRDPSFLAQCRALIQSISKYPSLAHLHSSTEWADLEPCMREVLGTIRRFEPPAAPPAATDPGRVRAVHWNLEHGNRYPRIEAALVGHRELADADVHLFNEIDLGMARAGNRDV